MLNEKMQNAKCKMQNAKLKAHTLTFAFCILHFAFTYARYDIDISMSNSGGSKSAFFTLHWSTAR